MKAMAHEGFPGRRKGAAAPALLAGLAVLVLAGCAPAWKKGEEYRATLYPEPPPARKTPAGGSSLWDDRAGVFFADRRARKVNDVITIVVDEAAKASKAAGTSLSRQSAADMGFTAFLGLEKTIPQHTNIDPKQAIKTDGTSTFDGSGKTTREETLTTTVSAIVREILPGGNMVIEARRDVAVNGEKQVMILHGIVRPEDVDGANAVPSSRVANARIEYYGEGDVSDKQNPGWLARIIDRVWPF